MHKLNLFSCFILFTLVLSSIIYHADGAIMNPYLQCADDSNITAQSSSKNNILNNLLNSLAANGPLNGGFYNTSAGNGSDKIYGLIQCRGDTSFSNCSGCTKAAAKIGLEACTKSTGVSVWQPLCFLRYSYHSFFGSLDLYASLAVSNSTDLQDPANVTAGLNLMSKIAAMTPDQPLMFYAAETGKMHGMAQCTRDMSKADCGICLDAMLMNYTNYVGDKREWVIYGASCSLWYLNDQVYVNASTSAGNRNTMNNSSLRVTVSLLVTIASLILSPYSFNGLQSTLSFVN